MSASVRSRSSGLRIQGVILKTDPRRLATWRKAARVGPHGQRVVLCSLRDRLIWTQSLLGN